MITLPTVARGCGEDVRSYLLEKLFLIVVTLSITACASLPENVQRTPSYVLADTSSTSIARNMQPLLDKHPGLSGFRLLDDGLDAFAYRMRSIAAAEKSIDAQYYIWHTDLTGKVMYNALLRAADRGVRVRILLDDFDTAGKDEMLKLINAHPGIEVRVYNPFSNRNTRFVDIVTDTRRIDRRMHTKTLTVDNHITFFGGRNIGDEYFSANKDVIFGDMDAMAIGPIVPEISTQFDQFWNSEFVYPITAFEESKFVALSDVQAFRAESDAHLEVARNSEYSAIINELDSLNKRSFAEIDFSWSKWFLAYDHPDNVVAADITAETNLAPRLKQGMDLVKEELNIVSPYFVPGEAFTEYLISRVAEGVRVRILTNSLGSQDVGLVHAGYMRYREELIRGGVELYEFKAVLSRKLEQDLGVNKIDAERAGLHAKFFGFDRRYMFIGSFNLDPRSVNLNTELGAYFESPEKARKMAEVFDEGILLMAYRVELDADGELEWLTVGDNGELVRLDHEPDTTFWQRFITRLLVPIVPESKL